MPNDLSIIIPAFNAEATLAETIRSARRVIGAQVVVVDDGSSDRSPAIAAELADRVIVQANAGASAARRAGVAATNSTYIIFLDSDDEVVADGVAESLRLMSQDGDVAVVGGRVVALLPNGTEKLLPRKHVAYSTESLLTTGFGPWPPAAAVVRRSAFELALATSPEQLTTRYAEDYELVLRLSLVGTVVSHDHVSARYRMFVGKSNALPVAALEDKETIRRHYAEHVGVNIVLMSPRRLKAAAYLRDGRAKMATGRPVTGSWRKLQGLVLAPDAGAQKLMQIGRRARTRVFARS